jgi:hypothetical protein
MNNFYQNNKGDWINLKALKSIQEQENAGLIVLYGTLGLLVGYSLTIFFLF